MKTMRNINIEDPMKSAVNDAMMKNAQKMAGEQMKRKQEEIAKQREEEQKAIEAIKVVVPEGLQEELNLTAATIKDIVVSVRQEEYAEKVKDAKGRILKATKIVVNKDEVAKLKAGYKATLRTIKFKHWQLANEIIEKADRLTTKLKPVWGMRCELDSLELQKATELDSLRLSGVTEVEIAELEILVEGEKQ